KENDRPAMTIKPRCTRGLSPFDAHDVSMLRRGRRSRRRETREVQRRSNSMPEIRTRVFPAWSERIEAAGGPEVRLIRRRPLMPPQGRAVQAAIGRGVRT